MTEALLRDVRYGARSLLRAPGFTAVAALTLALGVGANTAIFSVVNAVLLRPLPFTDPDRIVTVWEDYSPDSRSIVSASEIEAYRAREDLFEGLAAINQVTFSLRGDGEPEQVRGALVSAGLFGLLGVQPEVGRTFAPDEDRAGRGQVVLLAHELWQRRFGGDPEVIGRSLTMDLGVAFGPRVERADTYTVAGVLPPRFRVPFLDEGVEVYAPLALTSELLADDNHYLFALGRLRPGVSVERAQRDLRLVGRGLDPSGETHDARPWRVDMVPLREVVVGDVRPALLVLLGAVGFVLLTACANVANLLLARAAARRRELAVRAALGAGQGRLLRQLVTESVLLAALGGAGGLALAYWGVELLSALAPADLPRVDEVGLDGAVLLFTLGASLLTAFLFGLAPALHAARPDLRETLQEGGRGVRGERRGGRLRAALVVAEVALALLLLVGAGLLLRSFAHLRGVEPGFEPAHGLTMNLSLSRAKYPEPEQVAAFQRELLREFATLPGVRAAGSTSSLPLSGWNSAMPLLGVEGRPPFGPGEGVSVSWRTASEGYFRAMGVRLLRGRSFTEAETGAKGPTVLVVNRTLAGTWWPGQDPIGRRLQLSVAFEEGEEDPWIPVAGVVEDVVDGGPQVPVQPMVYFPDVRRRSVDLVLRAAGDPAALASAARRTVLRLDPDQPVSDVRTLQERLDRATAGERFNALLLAAFAALALTLAGTGVYGIVAYGVTQRAHEIGVRVALGAENRDVLVLVVRRGIQLVGAGVALGLLGAAALTRVLESLLYGVEASDPAVFAGVALLLGAVALAASGLPALSAARLDPVAALREP